MLPPLSEYELMVYGLPDRYPSMAGTFPHHKHIPPDVKRHRVAAPGVAFDRPNLPGLIEEIERDLLPAR